MRLFKGKHLNLVEKDGWEYVERNNITGIVAILAITDDDEILLVQQYRPPVGRSVIELPAGLVGDEEDFSGENMEEAAKRELLEETGYSANRMEHLIDMALSPGIISEVMSLFKAHDLTYIHSGGGIGRENIKVHKVRLERLPEWLAIQNQENILLDAKVYSALQFI